MSIRIMSHVWQHSAQKGSALLTLLAIADMANDDGECWPGVDRLAKKTRMTERNLQMTIRKLEEAGELQVVPNAGAKTKTGCTNRYKVILKDVPEISPLPKSEEVKPTSPLEVKPTSPLPREEVKPTSPESSIKEESSLGNKNNTPDGDRSTSEPEKQVVRPRDFWYDAVQEVFKFTGARNKLMCQLLQGSARKVGWSEYNLETPLKSPEDLKAWAGWYRRTYSDRALVEAPIKVQSSIGEWQVAQQMTLEEREKRQIKAQMERNGVTDYDPDAIYRPFTVDQFVSRRADDTPGVEAKT